jgi:hypothetical protein
MINGNTGCMEDCAMKRFALESGNCLRSFICVLAAVLAVSFLAVDGGAQTIPIPSQKHGVLTGREYRDAMPLEAFQVELLQ